jgi:two-component system chemotaxis response regulator CheB
VQVLCIGCSTGGPEALTTVLKNLPAGGSLPIFVVQHMPPFFTTAFAAQLARDTGRPCREASNGEVAVPGTCYLAPGGYHMSVGFASARVILKLDQGPEENFCRPSVDVLFRSVAACFGSATLALVLTGMGKDGVLGAKAIVRRGGRVLVQDEASSVVWGMPGAVARAGLACAVLPLADIGGKVNTMICGARA